MNNLDIYNAVRNVPKEAKKPIQGGRLKGMTDINPMWRIKALTEQFGPCGIGWRYEIKGKHLETGGNNEIASFVDINLFVKIGDAWSEAIPGTGGSMFVAKERNGLYTSDECFKMALTDAIGVACKALGLGADVYWDSDTTKYPKPEKSSQQSEAPITREQLERLSKLMEVKNITPVAMQKLVVQLFNKNSAKELTESEAATLIQEIAGE